MSTADQKNDVILAKRIAALEKRVEALEAALAETQKPAPPAEG